jgi:Protein of unknown function (DUF4239)
MSGIYLWGLIWVLGVGIVTGALTIVIHRVTSGDGRLVNNESAGVVFTIVGGLQAVLIAFVLITLFDAATAASNGAQTEANSLVAVSWAADSLPDATRTKVHDLTRKYANTVRGQEWPQMRAGEPVTGPGAQQLAELHAAITDAASSGDEWLKDRKTEAANQLWQVYQSRQQRLDAADGSGVNAVVWFVLIVGGLLSVSYTYLFGGPKLIAHVVIVGTLAATITLLLYSIYQMQDPFTGGANVSPDAFTTALARLG